MEVPNAGSAEEPVGGPGFCSISPALRSRIKIQATVTSPRINANP